MLNLHRSRAKAVRILLGAVMVMVSLTMLTYLIPSFGAAGAEAGTAVAQVGKTALTQSQVQNAIQNMVSARELPADAVPSLVPGLVREMLTNRALAYEANQLGLRISDADLRAAIRGIYPQLYPDGHFVGIAAYSDLLAQQNETIPSFEAAIRRGLLAARLLEIVDAGVVVTPEEIEQAYRRDHEKFRIQWVKLTPRDYRDSAAPSEADIESYFVAHRSSFTQPEERDVAILIADPATVEKSLAPPDAELKRIYDANAGQYRIPETVDFRQILLANPGAQAQDLVRQLRAGADFAALAAKYSVDANSAARGGEYQNVRRGQLEPALERVIFSLKPGQTGGPVQTSYGVVIVRLQKHQAAGVRPYPEVREELAQQWGQQHGAAKMREIAQQAGRSLRADSSHPEKTAARLGMRLVRAPAYVAGNTIPGLSGNAALYQAIAGLQAGGVSEAVPLDGGGFAIAVLEGVTAARPSTLAEARSRIGDLLAQRRAQAAALDHARELSDRAKAMAGNLEKAAQSMGLETRTSDLVQRSDDVPGLGPLTILSETLAQPAGTLFGPVDLDGGSVVGKIVEKKPADMGWLAAQQAGIGERIRAERTKEREELFESGLRQRLAKAGQLRINQAMVDKVANGFAR